MLTTILCLSIFAVAVLGIWAYNSHTEYTQIKTIPETSKYNILKLTNGYDNLENQAQKTLYFDIYQSVCQVSHKTVNNNTFYVMKPVKYSGNDEITDRDMVIAYTAFKIDNPEYFWLKSNCNPESNFFTGKSLYIYSAYSPEEIQRKTQDLTNAVQMFLNNIPSDLTEAERQIYVHDYMRDICEYATNTVRDSYNVYGVLVNGHAVCQGYAEAYSYLLSLVGVNSTSITNQEHIWNAVELDNHWSYSDATWDDTTNSYRYFDMSEKELLRNYELAPHYSKLSDEEITGTDTKPGLWFNVFIP